MEINITAVQSVTVITVSERKTGEKRRRKEIKKRG